MHGDCERCSATHARPTRDRVAAILLLIVAAFACDDVALRRTPAATSASAAAFEREDRAAALRHPDATAVVAPGPALDARRLRLLLRDPGAPDARSRPAVVLLVVAAFAGDRAAAWRIGIPAAALVGEIPGAALVHPDAVAVPSPRAPLDARRIRGLRNDLRARDPAGRAVVGAGSHGFRTRCFAPRRRVRRARSSSPVPTPRRNGVTAIPFSIGYDEKKDIRRGESPQTRPDERGSCGYLSGSNLSAAEFMQ